MFRVLLTQSQHVVPVRPRGIETRNKVFHFLPTNVVPVRPRGIETFLSSWLT